jgi:beta-lactamase class A
MKVTVGLLSVLILVGFGLVACGDDGDTGPDADPTPTSSPATATSEPEPTATAPPAPTPVATADPTATAMATGTPEADVRIPETPVGEQLTWFIGVLNSPNPVGADEYSERFATVFTDAVPLVQFVAITAQTAAVNAPFTLTGFAEPPTFSRAVAQLQGTTGEEFLVAISVEETSPYRINGLQIIPAEGMDMTPDQFASWDELDATLTELASQASFLVSEVDAGGTLQPVHSLNGDERLGIGSAFKLYILGELAQQVESGNITWDDELGVREEWKSLPSGVMQNLPDGVSVSLQEYARQMISISDNTATDHLLFHLGRENVEAFQSEMGHAEPSVNVPMMSTRELFVLKLVFTADQRAEYLSSSADERRAMLDGAIAETPVTIDDAMTWSSPIDIQSLEWFASVSELSQAMVTLRDMSQRPGLEPVADILSINPGIEIDPDVWTYVGYKGGSEPGVLNLTWVLERADGRWFTLSVTLNDPDSLIDEMAALRAVSGAVLLLEQAR